MGLENLKGNYDAIFSLGDLCLTSMQLQKNNLRNFSGVLDWMASPFMNQVNRLLENRFVGFFDEASLRIIGYASENIICVSDDGYHLVSNHDFHVHEGNSLQSLAGYHKVMEKYGRRIRRSLEKMESGQRTMFIRTEATFEDTAELVRVLRGLVKNDFEVLIVNHTDVPDLTERHWPIANVTVVEMPNFEKWNGNDHLWRKVFEGVSLTNVGPDEGESLLGPNQE